jgi:hypothetical protein
MKVKKILSFIVVFSFLTGCFMLSGFSFFKKNTTTSVQQVAENYSKISNNLWCITFQLVWNEFSEKMLNGKPIKFIGGNPVIADELNKKLYNQYDISDNSYYVTSGKLSSSLKKQIEKDINKKFNEKSDILDFINWNAKNSYLFYSMLKKEFTFKYAFDELIAANFNNSTEKVKYFGINSKSDKKLYKNVQVLFYNSDDDFAVKFLTNENEEVIFYRTDKKGSFENLYSLTQELAENTDFTSSDVLTVPEINVDKTISYDDLTGKQIVGTDLQISQALQTIKFKMDNKGGSLKSEAAMTVMRMSLVQPSTMPRYFVFNKPFVLFLKEQAKEKPYYAMRIDNTDYLVKAN